MSDTSTKAAITVTENDYKVIKSLESNVPKLLRQSIPLFPFAPCTFPNNFIFKLMNATMICLIEAGIPQYHLNYLMDFDMMALPETPSEPSILSIYDLEFGFVTWLIACGISIGAFLAELLWHFMKKEGRRLMHNFSVLSMILQFVEFYRGVN